MTTKTDTDRVVRRRLRPGDTRVDRSGDCWEWRGALRHGYGVIHFEDRVFALSRLAYAIFVGPIPDGMTVDHLCFNPPCINPDHLRLLTHSQNCANQRRALQPTCKRGHPFDATNTRTRRPDGSGRDCRACNTIRARGYRARRAVA